MTTELREILARNLRQLMRDRYDLDTQVKIRERSKQYTSDGKGLAQATIQRILACKVHAGIDTLDVLSKVYGVTPVSLITDKETSGQAAPLSHSAAPSAFGRALAGLYDDLPNDVNLRARMYHHVSGFLLHPDTLPATPSSAAPAPTVSQEKQRG